MQDIKRYTYHKLISRNLHITSPKFCFKLVHKLNLTYEEINFLVFFLIFSLKSLFKKLVQIDHKANFIRDYTAKVFSTVPTPQASSNVFESRFSKPVEARNDKAASNCAVVLTCKHNHRREEISQT